MILSCKSCEKKFVVPDNAIPATGRLVQCSSCGNKWKQFPAKIEKKTIEKPFEIKTTSKKSFGSSKIKKRNNKKRTGPNLYSPEYLAKKHGIKIKDTEPKSPKKAITKDKVSFGFYNSILVFFILAIFFSRTLYFTQNFIIMIFPNTEFYLSYFFENIRNIFEIWKSLIANY